MSAVSTVVVGDDEADLRLDRWFRRHYPDLQHGHLQKLLRTGQVRVDGRRAEAGQRLTPGQAVRVPPLPAVKPKAERTADEPPMDLGAAAAIRGRVIYRDDDVLAIDKPAGLAVQGGTGTHLHVDGLLDALRFGADERPRLVHRLDRDTTGVLVIARNAKAAAHLAAVFRSRDTEKTYWAVVVGVPQTPSGRIDLALAKRAAPARQGREAMTVDDEGDYAVTEYRTLDRVGRHAALLELRPLTGRTHQLRAHCAAIGCPILGDFKYGGSQSVLPGLGRSRHLHLHARALVLPLPVHGRLRLEAELPEAFRATLQQLGLDPAAHGDRS